MTIILPTASLFGDFCTHTPEKCDCDLTAYAVHIVALNRLTRDPVRKDGQFCHHIGSIASE